MIMIIAAVVMVLWAVACRRIHLDLVDAINKQVGRLVIPRSFTLRFFIAGCVAILAVALASIGLLK